MNLLEGVAICFILLIICVIGIANGAVGSVYFYEPEVQERLVLMIAGLFDRIFIDWYWVGKTKAWFIPGTEDLMPYVPKKVLLKKWIGTVVGYPVIAAIQAAILALF